MARELLFTIPRSAFRMDVFRAGGKGGQNQNKVSSGVRIVHLESGAVGEARDERDQLQNRRHAFQRLRDSPRFRAWLNRKVYEHDHRCTVEQEVDEMMQPEYIASEVRDGDRWVPWAAPAP